MAQFFSIHPDHPQKRLIRQAADLLRGGGLLALPTDSAYALAGHLGDAKVIERIRQIRNIDDRHHFTLMCRNLAEISTYARVDNVQYRILKSVTPGPYTFVLEATKELPRRFLHPKRKTIGLRIPAHPLIADMLDELGEPLLSSTLIMPGEELPLTDAEEILARLGKAVDLVVECGHCGIGLTTVVELTSGAPELIREGLGALTPLGL